MACLKSMLLKIKDIRPIILGSTSEMTDIEEFIEKMVEAGHMKYGIICVIPPKNYKARDGGYDTLDEWKVSFVTQVRERLEYIGYENCFKLSIVPNKEDPPKLGTKPITVKTYRDLVGDKVISEFDYWSSESMKARFVEGLEESFFDPKRTAAQWNPNKYNGLLDRFADEYHWSGLHSSFMYLGSAGSSFAGHVENFGALTIGYLHDCGKGHKYWYGIPPKFCQKYIELLARLFPRQARECRGHLLHKIYSFSPEYLLKLGFPVWRLKQPPGSFVFTLPCTVHFGFNSGYCVAESSNFATKAWIPYARHLDNCTCDSQVPTVPPEDFARLIMAEYEPALYAQAELIKFKTLKLDDSPFAGASLDHFCDHCYVHFKSASALRHHKTNLIPVPCSMCGETYTPTNLARHERDDCKKRSGYAASPKRVGDVPQQSAVVVPKKPTFAHNKWC